MATRKSRVKRRVTLSRRFTATEYLEHVGSVVGGLEHLVVLERKVKSAEKERADWVGRLRSLGTSWADIGEAVGMSRQAAEWRYDRGKRR